MRSHHAHAALLAALVLLAPLSCASKPPTNPRASLQDDDKSIAARERAIEALAADLQTLPPADARALREELKSIAWARNEPFTLRSAAVEALIDHDPDDARTMLALMLPTEPSSDMAALIADAAVARNWTDLTPALVRSWARPRPGLEEGERPEPPAIAALHPNQSTFDAVFAVFATPDPDQPFNDKQRNAAWEILGALDPTGEQAAQRLAALPPTSDPLVAAVQDAAVDLHTVPVTQEQLDWLTQLRDDDTTYAAAQSVIARLTPAQREGLALRHAPALAIADAQRPELLSLAREDLLSELRQRLASRKTHPRSAEGAARDPLAESLPRAEPDLAWADLVHILLIDDALQTERLAAQLFDHADRDHADTSTEYGGVLARDPAAEVTAILYPPRPAQRRGDKRFVAAPEMFTQRPAALAHFHFHVQSHTNARYAGPGPGDRAYADAYGRANLVLTFTNKDTLAVDYYHPAGLTLDLGDIKRP